jgi:Niemann-Pick C1 protein
VQDAHKIFLREIVINLAIALSGVFLIVTLMMGSLVPSLIVTTLLIIIDIEVLGSIYLAGDYFNTVTGINLVLAVGLSVDALAHITHSFLAHDGTGNERAALAVTEIGRSVFNGAMSTLIVLIPLAAARSYVFQVFFRTFAAIIGFSAFHGLVVLPVILSVVQPTSYNTIRTKLGISVQGHDEKDGQSAIDSAKADHQRGSKADLITTTYIKTTYI